jgi:phosphate transport system substrate-binding protein
MKKYLATLAAASALGISSAPAGAQTPSPSSAPVASPASAAQTPAMRNDLLVAAPADPMTVPGPAGDVLRSLQPYAPAEQVSGTLRLWTRPPRFFGALTKAWEEGFTKFQPGIKFDYTLYGTASIVGALYMDAADVGVLGEEIHPLSAAAFERVKHHPPLTIAIATCNLDVKNFGAANVFFVNKDNPLTQLTLVQLDGILGSEHRRGSGNIRTWGQLGLTGEWADQPIHPYTWLLAESFCLYLQHAILADSHEWSSAVTEFVAGKRPDGTPYDDGEQILDSVSRDRYGIGVSSLTFRKPGQQVKALALAVDADHPYYEATKENLILQNYPLSRLIPAVIDHPPGKPLDPKVREFMRYLLSRDGQWDLVRTHGYLPLNKDEIAEQLKKLL